MPESPQRWDSGSKALHWTMAVLILGMLALGWIAVSYPMSPDKIALFTWHKSIGLLILGLVLIRLCWRWSHRAPAPPPGQGKIERSMARSSHVLLYALMIIMPVTGYVINSTAGFPFRMFGLVRIPNLVPVQEGWQDIAESIHLTASWLLVALIVLHILAALKHHYQDGDDVMRRMLPGRRN